MPINSDIEAYAAYPQLRQWFNKLWISEQLGYDCGPGGIAPTRSGWYVVRPAINLRGMGAGARRTWIEAGDRAPVPPGHFWCEWFSGVHRSATFTWSDDSWKQISCWVGENRSDHLSRFSLWRRDREARLTELLPDFINQLQANGVTTINIEAIDDKIIEIHLRGSADPSFDVLVPVWLKDREIDVDAYVKAGYIYIDYPDDADGYIEPPRAGFLVK
jgi:hypothetical protein